MKLLKNHTGLFQKFLLAKLSITLLLIGPAFKPGKEHPDLFTAAKNKLVTYTITGNTNSSHYLKPVLLNIQNLKKTPVTVSVDNGLELNAKDSIFQNMVITKDQLISLKPFEKKSFEVFAMCTEPTDKAPGSNTLYTAGLMAHPKMLELTHLIQKGKYYDITGQSAIWALSANRTLEDITGFDSMESRKLQTLVSQLTGKPMPPPPSKNDYLHNYQCHEYVASIGGSFEFSSSRKMSVVVAMFDKNNIVVRELYKNTDVEPGPHKFNYEFDATVYKDDYYYIRFIADDNIKLSRKVSMKI